MSTRTSKPPASKRRRIDITAAQKRELCVYKDSHPKSTQAEIRTHFTSQWGVTIGLSTISDILKEKAKWLAISQESDDVVRLKAPKYEKLETCLFEWFSHAQTKSLPLSDDMLIAKARFFGGELDIPGDFMYSRGWLCRFKKRHGIKQFKAHGEAGSAKATVVQAGRADLQRDLQGLSLCDIYNMDETGLFYRLEPNQTLATAAVPGRKKCKDRITVALCSNADGSHRLKPLIIGKAARPRCFGRDFEPRVYCDYHSNKTAWMTSVIFTTWLKDFDRQMRLARRHVVLLMDNATSHSSSLSLTNIRLIFLPPNTTAHIQPMDAGIIRNFKLQYRKRMTQHLMTCLDDEQPMVTNIRQALVFVKASWASVKDSTISNCWRHVNILPTPPPPIPDDEEDDLPLAELRRLISRLPQPDAGTPMTAAEFVDVDQDEPTGDTPTDDDILKMVKPAATVTATDPESDSEDETPLPPRITLTEGRQSLQTLIACLEQRPLIGELHLDSLWTIFQDMTRTMTESRTQTTLDSFFTKS